MSPKNKFHPEIYPVGKPGQNPKPFPVDKPSMDPNVNITYFPPAGSTPKRDPGVTVQVPNPKDPKNYPSPG
jgi:hypothetical protein